MWCISISFVKRLFTWNKMTFSSAFQTCRLSDFWNKFKHVSGINSVWWVLVKNKTNHIQHRRGFADEDDILGTKTYWRSSKSWIALGICFWCLSVEKTEHDSSQVWFPTQMSSHGLTAVGQMNVVGLIEEISKDPGIKHISGTVTPASYWIKNLNSAHLCFTWCL